MLFLLVIYSHVHYCNSLSHLTVFSFQFSGYSAPHSDTLLNFVRHVMM